MADLPKLVKSEAEGVPHIPNLRVQVVKTLILLGFGMMYSEFIGTV